MMCGNISLEFSARRIPRNCPILQKEPLLLYQTLVTTDTTNNRHACSALFLICKVFVNLD